MGEVNRYQKFETAKNENIYTRYTRLTQKYTRLTFIDQNI